MSLTVVFGMGTCVSSCVWSPEKIPRRDQASRNRSVELPPGLYQLAAIDVVDLGLGPFGPLRIPQRITSCEAAEAEIKVVKLSSVSTGPLRRLHALHCRPINLVVYQGTSRLASNET